MTHAEKSERNKAIIARLPALLETLDEGLVKSLFTEDFRLHDVKFPDWPTGHAGALRMFSRPKAIMPDFRATIEEMFGEGDKVCVRWRFTGTVTAKSGAGAGDTARFEAIVVSIYRLEEGRIAEDWGADIPLPEGHPWRTT